MLWCLGDYHGRSLPQVSRCDKDILDERVREREREIGLRGREREG